MNLQDTLAHLKTVGIMSLLPPVPMSQTGWPLTTISGQESFRLTVTYLQDFSSGHKGITSNIVTVGYVQTEMTKEHMAGQLHDFWMKHCPLKKISSAKDVAHLIYFLCSQEGSFINGEVIRVSGGLTYAP